MIVVVNNQDERDIVINYLNLKKGLNFQLEEPQKSACFVIETEKGIVVTAKPEYIAFHIKKTNDAVITFTKFVHWIMLGHLSKLNRQNKTLTEALDKYRDLANRQNEQVQIFQEIFKL